MKGHAKRWASILLTLCLCLSLLSLAPAGAVAETEVKRVLVQTTYTPVAMMDLQYVKVTTSTNGASVASATWYDSSRNAITGKFGTDTCHLEVRLTLAEGYVFAENVDGYINNTGATLQRESDTSVLLISHDYKPEVWAPVPIKNPGPETVTAGGWASFVVSSMYTQDHEWCVESPDGSTTYTMTEAKTARDDNNQLLFPGLDISGENTDTLLLKNIPASMDGWKVFCRFWSVEHRSFAKSGKAAITVKSQEAEVSPAPSPEESPEPSDEPSPTPTATPTPSPTTTPTPTPSPTPEVHEHEPAAEWSMDETHHWHVCRGCEELLDRAEHKMVWNGTNSAGEETGECSVCGYKATRIPIYEKETEPGAKERIASISNLGLGLDAFRYVILGIFGAIGIGIVALLISSAVGSHRGRSRRRRRK